MKLPGLRWLIVGLLLSAAVLNYVDKNTLSLLAPTIQKDLGFDDRAYAWVQNMFQLAYTVALLASGALVDGIGPRQSLAWFVGWWSSANILTSLSGSVGMLGGFRAMLGLGEAGNWIASPKTVAEWFPARERGLAIGIYTAGTPIGMALAPLLIIGLSVNHGWRSVFIVTGALGILWLAPWLYFCRPVHTHPMVTEQEKNWILQDGPAVLKTGTKADGWSWLQAFGKVEVWCLLIGRMLSDPIWFFYQNWFPKYLVSVRGLTQAQVKVTWVIFLAAGVGGVVGGWVAGRFITAGRSSSRVRLFTMLGCALLMPISPLVAHAPTVSQSLACASIIVFAHLAWLTNISALVVDVVPSHSLGTVFGIVAAGSSLGAIGMNSFVAKLVSDYSYTIWFYFAAGLHLLVIPLLMWGLLYRKRATA